MSGRMFRTLNELTLSSAGAGAVLAAVFAMLGQSDQALMVWALVALAVGGASIVVNASLEHFRPNATSGRVR